MFPRLAKSVGNTQNVVLPCWLKRGNIVSENKESLMRIIINRLSKKSGETSCYRACSLANFDLVIPYFGPIHAVFMTYIPQQSYKTMSHSPRPSKFFPFFPFSFTSTSPSAIVVCLPLLGNILKGQY